MPQFPCQYRKEVQDSRASLHSTESSVVHGVVSRGGRLQLSHLQPAQAGTYTCVAENAQAEARKDFVVSVLGASVLYTTPSLPHPQQPLLLAGPHHGLCVSQCLPRSRTQAWHKNTMCWRNRRFGCTVRLKASHHQI